MGNDQLVRKPRTAGVGDTLTLKKLPDGSYAFVDQYGETPEVENGIECVVLFCSTEDAVENVLKGREIIYFSVLPLAPRDRIGFVFSGELHRRFLLDDFSDGFQVIVSAVEANTSAKQFA